MLRVIFHASLMLFCAACSVQSERRQLPGCWNVNLLGSGPVKGKGLFNSSMEGRSLDAPQCSDDGGRNEYELAQNAAKKLDIYFADPRRSSQWYTEFYFEGDVSIRAGRHILIISDVKDVKPSAKPSWQHW